MSEKILNNLNELATSHKCSTNDVIVEKSVTSNFFITCCHSYGTDKSGIGENGYDWFFVEQRCILNGQNNYEKKWAGSRITVNDESWYVGQGDVCLKYVSDYEMEAFIDNADANGVQLITTSPIAANDTTTCTTSVDFNIGGGLSFEAGKGKDGPVAKGSLSLNAGAGFSRSESFDIKDCSVSNFSNQTSNKSTVKWKYDFRKASQNVNAGHWQELREPATLSHSTFTPTNMWIWKIPTKNRKNITHFKNKMGVHVTNTISRYSGSQSPIHIPYKDKKAAKDIEYVEQSIPLIFPKLLSSNMQKVVIEKQGGSKEVDILYEGSTLEIACSDESWLQAEFIVENHNFKTLMITASPLNNASKRNGKITIKRKPLTTFENENDENEITIIVSQIENLIK